MINPKTFIEDFRVLRKASPQCAAWTRASENCDYGDIITVSKDCYMCFNSGNCQDAYYCEDSRALKDCSDCSFCESCELCYECVDCDACYNCNYCQDCSNCSDLNFCFGLKRCKNCFGCVDLRDKEYCIFNQQYTKEDYVKTLAEFDMSNDVMKEAAWAKVEKLKLETPRMFTHQLDVQKCTGDYVYHSKNCHMCFDTRHTEDSGYITQANLDMGTRDSWDCGPIPTGMDLCYDVSYVHFSFDCKHLYWCGNLKNCNWCTCCMESSNLFGCSFLKNKEDGYYILNQKVDKQVFDELVPQIEKELESQGIFDLYDLFYKPLNEPKAVVDNVNRSRECFLCKSSFELCDEEIEFYKEHDINWPVYCFNCRADRRFRNRPCRKLYKRDCDACKNKIISTIDVDSGYIVYCLECWMQELK